MIESPTGRVVVVDAGGHPGEDIRTGNDPGNRVVLPFLRQRGYNAVDLIVPTHPDADHVQGLIALVERLTVRGALDGCQFDDNGDYHHLRQVMKRRGVPVYVARRGQKVDIGGGAFLEVLHPGEYPILGTASPTNDNCVVLRVVYGKARFLLTGDAGEAAESAIMASGQEVTADVLKAGHHGSRHSTGSAFLEAVRPKFAVISCGKNNTYGHPSPEVLARLTSARVPALRTDKEGAITVTSDGETLSIKTGRH